MNFRALMFAAAVGVFGAVASGYGQEATPSPSPSPFPTPVEMDLARVVKMPKLDSLKTPRPKPYESTDGRFRIDLPQNVRSYRPSQIFSQNATPRFGTIEWKLEEADIVIRFGMVPTGTATGATDAERQHLMASILDGMAADVAGSEAGRAYEKNFVQGGLPVREIKTSNKELTVIARIVLAGDDYYLLSASLRQVPDAEALVKKAFDSLITTK